jgi:hypothetical protein
VSQFCAFLPFDGHIGNLFMGLLASLFGLRALYAAQRGVWRPGPIRTANAEPVLAPWYLRVFLLLGGLLLLCSAWVFLRR